MSDLIHSRRCRRAGAPPRSRASSASCCSSLVLVGHPRSGNGVSPRASRSSVSCVAVGGRMVDRHRADAAPRVRDRGRRRRCSSRSSWRSPRALDGADRDRAAGRRWSSSCSECMLGVPPAPRWRAICTTSTCAYARAGRPATPVLLCNPWSGGGKVEQFGLVELAARARRRDRPARPRAGSRAARTRRRRTRRRLPRHGRRRRFPGARRVDRDRARPAVRAA